MAPGPNQVYPNPYSIQGAPAREPHSPMKKLWPFIFYFLQFAAVAFLMPFLVLFYQERGFNGPQIGLLTGLSPLITLVGAPLWTAIADRTRQHRLVMSLTLLAGSLITFAIPFLQVFAPVLAASLLTSFCFAPVSSLADNATMAMLGDEKDMYGRVRLGGTLGYALAAPVAGECVQRFGLQSAFWGYTALFLLALLASQRFVRGHTHTAPAGARPASRAWMLRPAWLLFLLGALGAGVALAFSNSYFFPYMKELGAPETLMGLSLTIGTIGEVPVLFFGHHLLRRLKAYPLFIIALLITGGRLLLLAAATAPWQALLIQLLNGLTFPPIWLAGVAYADENAPAGLGATAQGIFGAVVFGVGAALGGLVGGPVLNNLGAHWMSFIFGLVVLALAAVVIVARRLLPRPAEA